jgi:hypothetical protein
MDIVKIIEELRTEREQIEEAILECSSVLPADRDVVVGVRCLDECRTKTHARVHAAVKDTIRAERFTLDGAVRSESVNAHRYRCRPGAAGLAKTTI